MIMGNPKKTKTKNAKPLSERYTLTNSIANFFLLAVFAVFPLFVNFTFNGSFPFLHFDAGYIAIRHQKYYFFLVVTAAAVITELLLLKMAQRLARNCLWKNALPRCCSRNSIRAAFTKRKLRVISTR